MEEERMEQPRRRRKPKSFFRRLLELPKKTLLTLVAILVVFVAVIVIISKSCSATPDTTVTAQAFSTQTELKLPLSVKLNEGDYACAYSARFQSVIGTGSVSFVEETGAKRAALERIMAHLTGRSGWDFPAEAVEATFIFRLEVEELACKEHL